MACSLDHARVGPVPAPWVEVLLLGDIGRDGREGAFLPFRGKGRQAGGLAADDPDGLLELDAVGSMSVSVAARQIRALIE